MGRWIGGVGLAVLASVSFCAASNPLERDDEALVLTGADLPTLLGADVSRLVAFRFEQDWVQVPVQVDERAVVDFGTIYGGSPSAVTVLTYADPGTYTGPDPDPLLDADDEVVVTAEDAAATWADGPAPAHVDPGSGVEIEITDPIGGGHAYVYLFVGDGTLDPTAGEAHVSYTFDLLSGDYLTTYNVDTGPNPEDSIVATDAYGVHFSDRWIRDETRVYEDPATGVDILDRHKSLLGPNNCARSEDTFSLGVGAFIVNKQGPLRALRGYLGANSGPSTHRIHRFYESYEEIVTGLQVHSLPGIMTFFDYSADALGMIYRNSVHPTGVVINGVPDAISNVAPLWEMVSGPQGTLAMTMRIDTDIVGLNPTLYYSDREVPLNEQCTGDTHEYGASGLWIRSEIPNTDPTIEPFNRFVATRIIRYGGPAETAEFAEHLADEVDQPLLASTAPWFPSTTCPDVDGDDRAVCDASCSPSSGDVCGDNCPSVPNPAQENADLDALGDACDPCPLDAANDADGDGVCGNVDNCPTVANPGQANFDGDALGDACDTDDDNDGAVDGQDCAPFDPSAWQPPPEVSGLRVNKGPATALSWTPLGTGYRYDVIDGFLNALRTAGSIADATCLANDTTAASWQGTDPNPGAGNGVYYLVRAQNSCGGGIYGRNSAGVERVPSVDCP